MSAIAICSIGVVVVVLGILVLRLHAFLALLLAAFVVAALTPDATLNSYESSHEIPGFADKSASTRVADGLAKGCGKVAILIALAAVIGRCLLESGAAERIVVFLRRLFGLERTPLAFLTSGFLLGIPVFFDTVFFLMIPLVRAFARKSPHLYVLSLLSVVAGASMAHSLVPPTPGPLLVASELNVSLGVMIPFGMMLGIVTISSGYLYAKWANATFEIPMRESELPVVVQQIEQNGRTLPPIGLSLLPILGPLVLIATATLSLTLNKTLGPDNFLLPLVDRLNPVLQAIGDKNIALAIGASVSMLLVVRYRRSNRKLTEVVQEALYSGGVIILITAAGAALGEVLRQSGIATELANLFPQTGTAILLIAFCLTALVRFAQGSATVAMLTSVGIVAPMMDPINLGFHPVYLALAIGCGSKPLPWMNDSGFWIVGRMSGMNESETLKTFSVMLTIMGMTGFATVWMASKIFPMI